MSWNEQRSRDRIAKLLASVPEGSVRVENFATDYRVRRDVEIALGGKRDTSLSIDSLPYNAVVLTDGVHIYANLIDYDAYLEEQGRETEPGAARLLEFTHLHYSGLDRLIEAYGAQRVDHHGGRVHAVVLEPAGDAQEEDRILAALSLAAAMRELVEEASAAHQRRYGSRIRVGIESGKAIAINSGRGGEPEPLFIGDAANVAAKKADGDEEGVAVGPRASAVLALGQRAKLSPTHMLLDEAAYVPNAAREAIYGAAGKRSKVADAFRDFRVAELAEAGTHARFGFFRHDLPLAALDFGGLSPSRSARQESISIFADLSGFTVYVHQALASGGARQVVSNLHVLRGELAAALRDCGGRKIRFIGDCIHGVLAEGTRAKTEEMDSIRQAIRCAGALRSSFELCKRLLPGLGDLDLTIGIEYGTTPVTRLGIRGTRSVRCAASKAVVISERAQRGCTRGETALGATALAKAPVAIRKACDPWGRIAGLDYVAACAFAAALSTPAIARSEMAAAEPHSR